MKAADLTIRVADFPEVKAVLDAAMEVCEAQGDSPWSLSEKIDALRECIEELPGSRTDEEC